MTQESVKILLQCGKIVHFAGRMQFERINCHKFLSVSVLHIGLPKCHSSLQFHKKILMKFAKTKSHAKINEPQHNKTNKMAHAPR